MKGFININKPLGYSSAKVVAILKRKFGLSKKDKIGHMGTLDPEASGVLPIAVGRATRLFDFLLKKRKTYIANFTFGYETDTLDSEGEIISKTDNIPNEQQVKNALNNFLGDIEQMPPQYSAKSVNGVRAYDLARQGKIADLKVCKVHIEKFELLEKKENTYIFEIECGSGTYIRSLCRDLAACLNSKATMTALCRTKADIFTIENAVDIEEVTENDILPIDIVLQKLNRLNVNEKTYKDLLNGKKTFIDSKSGFFRLYNDNELLGICDINEDKSAKMKVWL